jgi:hypothetical protein
VESRDGSGRFAGDFRKQKPARAPGSLLVNFKPIHGDRLGSADAQANFVSLDSNDLHEYVVSYYHFFPDPSCQNKHGSPPWGNAESKVGN